MDHSNADLQKVNIFIKPEKTKLKTVFTCCCLCNILYMLSYTVFMKYSHAAFTCCIHMLSIHAIHADLPVLDFQRVFAGYPLKGFATVIFSGLSMHESCWALKSPRSTSTLQIALLSPACMIYATVARHFIYHYEFHN